MDKLNTLDREAGVRRRLHILQKVNHALKRPTDSHIAKPAKKKATSSTGYFNTKYESVTCPEKESEDQSLVIDLNKCDVSTSEYSSRKNTVFFSGNSEPDAPDVIAPKRGTTIECELGSQMLSENSPVAELLSTTTDDQISGFDAILRKIYQKYPCPSDGQVDLITQRYGISRPDIKAWFDNERKAEHTNKKIPLTVINSNNEQPKMNWTEFPVESSSPHTLQRAQASQKERKSSAAKSSVPSFPPNVVIHPGQPYPSPYSAANRMLTQHLTAVTTPLNMYNSPPEHPMNGRHFVKPLQIPKETVPTVNPGYPETNSSHVTSETQIDYNGYPSSTHQSPMKTPAKLREFFESIKDTELDQILAEVTDIKLDFPRGPRTDSPVKKNCQSQQTFNPCNTYINPLQNSKVPVVPQQYSVNQHLPLQTPLQTFNTTYQGRYSFDSQANTGANCMYQQTQNAFAHPAMTPTVVPNYHTSNYPQHFAPNMPYLPGYHQNHVDFRPTTVETSRFVPQANQPGSVKSHRHLPKLQGPNEIFQQHPTIQGYYQGSPPVQYTNMGY